MSEDVVPRTERSATPVPRVRSLEPQWIENDGQPALLLRDRLGLIDGVAVVPPAIAVLMSLCDGSRDLEAIRAAFELRTGVRLTPNDLASIVEQLDRALLLESPRYLEAYEAALAAYRTAPYRPPSLAGQVYSAKPSLLTRELDNFAVGGKPEAAPADSVRGIISPHIDYHRGGPIYARVWHRAAEAVRRADLAIIFGTDHIGGPASVTLTRQSFGTPYGVLPTATEIVERAAHAVGPQAAFAEELHHRSEHSIELAAVWLHYLRPDDPCPIVPILCGSFHPFTEGERDPDHEAHFTTLVEELRRATAGRRTIAIAAADLAHVGPAFGDEHRIDGPARQQLHERDHDLLKAVCDGDASRLVSILREERDQRKVCGLPPIYLLLRYLGTTSGEIVGYDQCSADAEDASWVSIAGVLLS